MQITRYNEFAQDPRLTALLNEVDTVTPVIGVGFSHPSGTMRLNDFTPFTHFRATFLGAEYIYKVTNWTAINSNVCEITYTVDFLKDAFYHDHKLINTNGLTCDRFSPTSPSTSHELWRRYAPDKITPIYTGLEDVDQIPFDLDPDHGTVAIDGRYLIIMKGATTDVSTTDYEPLDIYLTGRKNLRQIFKFLYGERTTEEESKGAEVYTDLFKQINAIYYVPFGRQLINAYQTNAFTAITDPTSGRPALPFLRFNADTHNVYTEYIPFDNNEAVVRYHQHTTSTRLKHRINANFQLSFTDFRDIYDKEYTMYIPFIGNVSVPILELVKYYTPQNINFDITLDYYYIYNLAEGTISISWAVPGYFSEPIAAMSYVPLPTVPYPTAAEATQIRNIETQTATGMLTSGLNLASSVAATAFTGGAAAPLAASSLGTFSTNMINRDLQLELAMRAGNSFTGAIAGWLGTIDTVARLKIVTKSSETDLDEAAGLICNREWRYIAANYDFNNYEKYWINADKLQMNRPDWYVDGVKRELNKDYIRYYNQE